MKLNMSLFIRRSILSAAFILLTCEQAFSAALESRLVSSRASAHPLIHEGLLTNPTEGLVIGNGDLAASVQIFSNELKLNLGKNDVWDTRYNSPSKTVDVAGGGYRHQAHTVLEKPTPLCNLYLELLHKFNIDQGQFGSSKTDMGLLKT